MSGTRFKLRKAQKEKVAESDAFFGGLGSGGWQVLRQYQFVAPRGDYCFASGMTYAWTVSGSMVSVASVPSKPEVSLRESDVHSGRSPGTL